ncbi:Kelch repeat-containing protein [Colletotrichum spaethianum]|uniref:Kelch repeat-containing protein n=1 Tax=Colletotrichum spaethianum TaxID=700344 RepID=A0AA37UJJ2_9PEZI|nr:Kelch repeat-containing protein [Colletotrichum spaethianum]GKT48136.1 Kelch repeat-containing protein [Colletotrichum spaethianum]
MLLYSPFEVTPLYIVLQLPAVVNAHFKRDWELAAAPSPSLFLRRAFARVAVLGDYAYIDGGEVSQLDADGSPIKSYASNGVNSTLSISLSKSWSASKVTIKELSKESQARSGQALWKNEATNTLWIWGGHSPNGAPRENPVSWKFEADGKGGGEWSKETPTNPTFFADLKRSEEGAFVSTPDAGFWFGGGASGWTNPNPVPQFVPGIVTYNMTTKSWANETTSAFSENGTLNGGSAIYIPTFGPNGLITVMGGSTSALDPDQKSPTGWLDFNNLTFFDPITRDWYWQQTTGNAPTARRNFCSVGVNGTRGTYEIFVFGGTNTEKSKTYDDVFVLSLPGFVWTQVIYDATNPRRYHSCAVVGRRQMLSVGGTDGRTGWSGADPWPQGLGLFDMTNWTWKTNYDADAKNYETSSTIQDWYKTNGINSVHWSSDKVKALFNHNDSKVSKNPKDDVNGDGKSSESSVPIAAIVGAVVGAVVGVIIGLALFWFIRRRSQKKGAIVEIAPAYAKDDTGTTSQTYYEPLPLSELHAPTPQPELSGGTIPRQELWAPVPKPDIPDTGGHHYTVTELDAQQGLLGSGDEDQHKYR